MINHPFAEFMQTAVNIAENGRWKTAPNPVVGAVLVRDGQIVAKGWHASFGGDHAEVACFNDAAQKGVKPSECTLVVTLEPCSHEGNTPPCTDAIIAAGIKHVVIGLLDINPVAAGGANILRYAGIQVETGILENECRDLIADYIIWQTTKRPYIILKMAATLDGRISTRSGRSHRITSEGSRAKVMELRANVGLAGGAVLVGGNTFIMDNPQLTARIPNVQKQPLAAIAISRLPGLDTSFTLIKERPGDCVFFSSAAQAASPNAQALRQKGARIFGLDSAASGKGLDISRLMVHLREDEKCWYVLCEGGGKLGQTLLEGKLIDEFHLHLAPVILGDEEALPMFMGRNVDKIDDAIQMRLVRLSVVDGDSHLIFRPTS